MGLAMDDHRDCRGHGIRIAGAIPVLVVADEHDERLHSQKVRTSEQTQSDWQKPGTSRTGRDVASSETTTDIRDVFAAIDREFGGLDFVVHGAAFAPREELMAPFVETSRDGFRLALDVSAYSLIAVSKRAAPLMERTGAGSILTLSYLGAERVFPNYNVMGVAKAALEASVRYLASDLGPKGIRVNAISAGPIKTLAASGISGFTNILQIYRERAPLRRTVDTGEVADAAMFLLSNAGRAVTGEVMLVDGGFHVMGM